MSSAKQQSEAPITGRNGFALVSAIAILLLIAGLMVLLNVVNSAGEFMLGKLVSAQAMSCCGDCARRRTPAIHRRLLEHVLGRVNLLAYAAVVRELTPAPLPGRARSLFVLPVIALVNYSVIMVAPVLAVVSVLKILENATDYSGRTP